MEEEIQFDLHVVWNMPLHLTRVESYVLFRKYLGKEDRGGTCSISVAETQEECADLGGEWTDSCSELSTDGDQVFETDNLTITEFYDSVGLPGIWRYAVFAKHESGDLTLCTTNTFLAREIYTLTVISDHGDIFGNILVLEGNYAQIRVVPHEGWQFTEWQSSDHNFEEPTKIQQNILMDSDKTVTAVFDIKKLSITPIINPSNLGKLENLREYYDYGTDTDIEAVGLAGGTLQEWIIFTEEDEYFPVSDPYAKNLVITMTKNLTAYAVFRRQRFQATIVSTDQGNVFGGGYGYYGDQIFVMAAKKPDPQYSAYTFERWEAYPEINAFIPNPKSVTSLVTIYGNVELRAIFSIPDPEAKFKLLDGVNEYGGNLLNFTDDSYDAQDNIIIYKWTNSLNSDIVESKDFTYLTPVGNRGDLPYEFDLTLYVEDDTGFSSTYTETINIKRGPLLPPESLQYDIKGYADSGLLLLIPPIVTKADSILVYNNVEYTKKLYN